MVSGGLGDRAQAQRRDDDLRDQAAACLIGMDARLVKEFVGKQLGAGSVVFDDQGERVLMGGWMDQREARPTDPARVWDSRTDELHDSGQPGYGVAAFHNGHPVQVVVKSDDRFSLVLWDVDGRKQIREWRLPEAGKAERLTGNNVPTLAFSPDGNWLAASASLDEGKGALAVWEVGSGKLVRHLPKNATALAFTPHGSHLAAGDAEGRISVWPLPQGEALTLPVVNPVTIEALAFGRDPRWRLGERQFKQRWLLAAGDAGGTVTVWDLESRLPRTVNWVVYDLDKVVVEHLPAALDIHDAIIVATALVFRDVLGENTAVITADAEITRSGLIQVIW